MIYFVKLILILSLIMNINIVLANGQDIVPLIPSDIIKKGGTTPDPCKRLKNGKEKLIKIFWYENQIKGHYYLVIQPKQIFFKTKYDYIAPNRLYWLADIENEQYNDIVTYLTEECPNHLLRVVKDNGSSITLFEFISPIMERPDDKLLHKYIKIFTNINLLIWDLNNNLEETTKTIEPPDPYFIFRLESAWIWEGNVDS